MPQFHDESTLRPTEGARFLLERLSHEDDGSRACYRAVIFTPQERFDYRIELDIEGAAHLTAQPPAAPADLEQTLGTIASLLARSAAKKRADQLLPWPPRVLRWRGPGRG